MEELFKKLGYQLLALPNSDVKPKMLLCKSGIQKAERLNAMLDDLFIEGNNVPKPVTKKNVILPEFRGKEVVDIKSSFGVELLTGLLTKLGIKDVKANAKWNSTDKVIFSFKQMKEDNINIVNLDKYIQDAKLDVNAATFGEKLEKDDLYIITAILKCEEFSIETVDYSLWGIDASATVEEIVEAHAKFEKEHTQKDGVYYKGDTPLAIAAKAVQITYNKPWWKSKEQAKYRIKPVSGIAIKGDIEYLTEERALDI